MSKAIILFSLMRFVKWQTVLSLILYAGLIGGLVAVSMATRRTEAEELARGILFGPVVPMFAAYAVIMPQVANYQRAKDGEYLSLLFTRPISRLQYIISKWVAGSMVVIAIMLLLIGGSLSFAALTGSPQALNLIDGYAVADVILNSLGYAALAVCIASFPMQLGVVVFMLIVYTAMIVGMGTGLVTVVASTFWGEDILKFLLVAIQFLYSFFVVGIDTYHLVNSSQSPIAGALAYVSNLVLYLTSAGWLMSKREFFYAND